MKIQDLLTAYHDYLRYERQLAPATITAYLSDLNVLSQWTATAVQELTLNDLREYMRHLAKRGLKPATIRRKMHGFSTFWEWLRLEGYVDEIITDRLRLPRRPQTIPQWLSVDELRRFANTTPPRRDKRLRQRDSLAWKTLVFLGLRRGELLNLQAMDVSLQDDIVIIRDTKNKEDRALPLTDPLRAAFRAWLPTLPDDEYVFASRARHPWGVGPFMRAFRRQVEAAGLADRDVTPHVIRHSFATHLALQGVHISVIKYLMGHKDIKSTMIYIHTDQESLQAAMERHIEGII